MQRFNNILCVVGTGEPGKPVLERAAALCEHHQATLTVVTVVARIPASIRLPDGGLVSRDLQAAMLAEQKARLDALIDSFPQLDVQRKVLLGTQFLEVIREVLRNRHDLVIKGAETHSWMNRLLAGDDMQLLRQCPCPVWLIKPGASATFDQVLAAVDVDEFYPEEELETRRLLNIAILRMAASVALSESAKLHIVHAWTAVTELADALPFANLPGERVAYSIERERQTHEQLLDDLLSDVKSADQAARDALDYLQPVTHLVKGSARREIPALAEQLAVDCIVLGTVARTGIRGFVIGNTAETILAQIDCSVLAIKPAGFETPVMIED